MPQEGERIKNIDVVNARIKAENREVGIVEIDPETLEWLEKKELPELEAMAVVIAGMISDRKGGSN